MDGDDDALNHAVADVAVAPSFTAKPSHEAKLRELLCNIISTEIKISSYASKEFAKLLKSENGGELLHHYVQASSNFTEFIEAWKIHQGNKLGMSYLFNLISDILSHSSGIYVASDSSRVVISRVLDKFASFIVREKLDDVYKEFNSKEPKRQKAALLLMAAIVRRGAGIANDVANSFNMKLPSFVKLASHTFRVNPDGKMNKYSTRKAFVWFAMSFLEVGKPWLLRGILQQRVMYSGVLRGLGNDDNETIDYVLSTLRDRVLIPESTVRPSLRSVLFGSATLELLATISGSENAGDIAEVAHQVLVMACTDPSNGLMPDLNMRPNPLKGNLKRLLDLMKKLKATEVDHHKDLLLAIVTGRPTFCAAYLDEYPYNLEDYTSSSWFAAVCLAANLVSSVGTESSFKTLSPLPSFSSVDMQNFLKCICPRPFSRSVINKGLLHSDNFVKHGTLRLLLESLKLLDSLLYAVNQLCCSSTTELRLWESLKREIQNEVQTFLPDPQVLVKLVSSRPASLKRKRVQNSDNSPKHSSNDAKKLKSYVSNEDTDIIISGINPDYEIALPGESDGVTVQLDEEKSEEINLGTIIMNIWGSHENSCSCSPITTEDTEIFLNAKLLDALTLYHRTMPNVLDGSFDFFVKLLSSPSTLPTNMLLSLLSLLLEYIGSSNTTGVSVRIPPPMYKSLHSFVNLLLLSPIKSVRDQAYCLARAAMISTGAFDRNLLEVTAWLLFLPGYRADRSSDETSGIELFGNLSPVVISFLCDAISTVGNKLFKYWDLVRCHTKRKGIPPNFSPLIICVLQKCLRLLNSDTATFTLPKKTAISLYTCNTLCYILQNQVDPGLLSSLIGKVLLEGLRNHSLILDDSGESSCEWRPLRKLWLFIQGISDEQPFPLISLETKSMHVDTSFANLLGEVQRGLKSGQIDGLAGVTTAFASTIICTGSDALAASFPLLISILHNLHGAPFSVLSSTIFLEQRFLFDVSMLWPNLFTRGLQLVPSGNRSADKGNGAERTFRHNQSSNTVINDLDYDSNELASVAFSYLLKVTPFHVIFPLFMRIGCQHLVEPLKIQHLLLTKLSGKSTDYLRSSLRIVLFWIHQIQLSYRNKQITGMYQLSEICKSLLDHLLADILVLKDNSRVPARIEAPFSTQLRDVAETIFGHPVVELYLARPLGCNEKSTDGILGNEADVFSLYNHRIHEMDHHILHMLKATSGYLLSLCECSESSILQVDDVTKKQLGKVLKVFVKRLFVKFRNNFEICIGSKNSMPLVATVNAIYELIHFIPPFELLELVHWMFNRIDETDATLETPGKPSALSVTFYIAGGAFEVLSDYLKEPIPKRVAYNFLWTMDENNCDAHLFEQIYYKLCNYATCLDLDSAFECLLKAVNVFSRQKYIENQQFLPLSFVALRVIESNPIQILRHSIKTISRNKANLLFALTELSPLHSSVFGYLFSAILDKDMRLEGSLLETSALSDEELMLLLPTALSYLKSALVKFGKQCIKSLRIVSSCYSRILLEGFLDWRSYVSHNIFEADCAELPSTVDKVINFFKDTLLGKAVQMLQYHIVLSTETIKMKKRLKLFDSVCSLSSANSGLLDCDINEVDAYSVNQSLNFINRLVARISFCRILLFSEDSQKNLPEGHEGEQDRPLGKACDKEDSARIRFVNMLVSSWILIVKKVPSGAIRGNMSDNLRLLKSLEVFILRNIADLTRKMSKNLAQLPSISFIEQLSRSSLLYRFEDPTTLRMLRSVLKSLSETNISYVLVLELLVSHSQFAPVITSILEPSGSELGAFYRPVSTVLKSPVISQIEQTEFDEKKVLESSGMYERQLEVIKLLRLLFTVKAHQFESENPVINFKELLMLLLSSYGATLNEIDLEIYHLMHDIESHEGLDSGSIAEIDYLWGTAALKLRNEQTYALKVLIDGTADTPAIDDRRRSQFRENIPVDLKLCLATVIHFPFDRSLSESNLSRNKYHADTTDDNLKEQSFRAEKIQRYDPVFILRFSIHSLLAGYIEPVEFAGFGLLAIAFVSISSSDNGIRKLGYEALSRFKHALENCQKRKDVVRLKLLLTYIQNGIAEPWQKIPSVIAIFAAEASFVLLDPSNDHYSTISNLLTSSSKVNLKCIPLFHNLLGSSSSNFAAERLWILRVAHAGLNLEDDAYIYIKNSIFETILSFYISPLSDNESQELILQILKKAVKLYKTARYLVEQCGFVSWLSSILSFCSGKLCIGQRSPHNTVIEITSDIISSRNTVEWLQKNSLEQLMEFSTHIYKLVVGERRFMKENAALFNSFLQIITSTIKISQKRRIFQPHFTLSVDGFFEIHEAVCSDKASGISALLGLKLILMSTPPATIFQKNEEKLLNFLSWATATAISSDATQTLQYQNSYHALAISSEELHEESMISKLLRWLTASVIIGKLSSISSKMNIEDQDRSKLDTLQSVLNSYNKTCQEDGKGGFVCEEVLTCTIFYLHQLQGKDCRVLPSVVSALCLVRLTDASTPTGSDPNSMSISGVPVASLLSKIRSPAEANPLWRWSYYQPWRDHAVEQTDLEKMDELHACRHLLVLISNMLGNKSPEFQVQSYQDLENSGVFKWERNILESE